jgi:hypothetical protein
VNGTEVFVYSILGFAAGCSVNAGYVMQLLYLVSIRKADRSGRFLFFLLLAAMGISCGVASVLVVLLVVFKDGWSWPGMGVYVFWLLVSMCASAYAFHRVAKEINPLLKQIHS